MKLLNEETVNSLLAGAKNLSEVTAGVATDLINEALNLYILLGILSVLKFAAIFVIWAILHKYFSTLPEEYAVFKKSAKAMILSLSLVFFVVKSFPHLEDIAKAMVAPKIFLIQKGAEVLKR
jgi:hypothetical protein